VLPCVRKQVGHQVRLGAIEVDADRAESFCPTSTPRMHPGREAMRWETLDWHGPRRRQQGMAVPDTSGLSPEQVAAEIVTWCRRALCGQVPKLSAAGA